MPIATPDQYAEMLDKAKAGGFAYPAFNVSSSQTINAVLQGLTEAGSDGIIQVTTGGADYFAGQTVKTRASGALAFADVRHRGRQELPDHRRAAHRPLPEGRARRLRAARSSPPPRRRSRRAATRSSSRTCGTARPCRSPRTSRSPKDMLTRTKAINAILEVEIGVVGGEEDGVSHDINEHLYTTLDDAIADRRGARPRRERPLHGRPHLRQRARRLQAGQREAAPGAAEGDPGRPGREVRHRPEAARPRLPRRLGLDRRRDRRGGRATAS